LERRWRIQFWRPILPSSHDDLQQLREYAVLQCCGLGRAGGRCQVMGSAPQPISVDPTLARKFGLPPLKSDVGTSFDTQNRPDASPFKAHIISLNAQQYSIDPSDTPLPDPSNRLTSSSMTVAREEIDAKLAASEARTEARFAEMNGKF